MIRALLFWIHDITMALLFMATIGFDGSSKGPVDFPRVFLIKGRVINVDAILRYSPAYYSPRFFQYARPQNPEP